MSKIVTIAFVFLCILLCSNIHSQNMKFPQSKSYPNTIKPNMSSQALLNRQVAAYYDYWKRQYLKKSTTTTGGYYVRSRGTGGSGDNLLTVSEAHGFGMIITVLMAGYDPDAEKIFDGLYKFFDERRANNQNLMCWAIAQNEWQESSGTATDGDLDIAYAMILASQQWNKPHYLTEAKTMIQQGIKAVEMSTSTNRVLLGDWAVSDVYSTRPSDWMTGHFRSFYAVTNDDFWNRVADNCYTLYENFAKRYTPNTWLISDFIVGQNGDPCPKWYLGEYERTDSYNFNACRVPWRISVAYGHYGDQGAYKICNNIVTWLKKATGGNPEKIAIGYELDGDPIDNSANSMAYSAPLICAATVDKKHQEFLNKGWYAIRADTNDIHQYEAAVNLLSMLYISGNWWKHGDKDTWTKEPDVSSKNVILDNFEDYYKDDPAQSMLGALYGINKIGDAGDGGGYWYPYYDSLGSTIKAHDDKIVTDKNSDDMVKDNIMHVKMNSRTSSAKNPYAGVGVPLVLKGTEEYFDLSRMDGITFRMKGEGNLRIAFATKDMLKWPEKERWGEYGIDVNLTSDWKDYKISTDYFSPQRYSPPEQEGWGWSHGVKEVGGLMIAIRDSADYVEMYLDSIVLNGLEYKKDFDLKLIVMENVTSSQLSPVTHSTRYVPTTKSVELIRTLNQEGTLTFTLVNTQGKTVYRSPQKRYAQGNVHYSVPLQQLPKGMFLVKTYVNNTLTSVDKIITIR